MLEQTEQNHRWLASQISKKMHELSHDTNGDLAEARKLAAVEIGAELNPPMTGEQLESWLGQTRAMFFPKGKSDSKPSILTSNGREGSVTTLYRVWCTENDYVTTDKELAFWHPRAECTFSAARANLKKEGFSFEKDDESDRWIVTERPVVIEEKNYSADEVKAMMEEMAANLTAKLMEQFGGGQ